MSNSEAMFRVLVVCTGNTCRSPMAAALLRRDLGEERIQVDSAGTAAWEGQPATEPTVAVAARENVDLRAHRSRRLTPDLVRSADLILVMERGHVGAVQTLGGTPDRIHVIGEWPAGGEPGLLVSDPFGGSLEAYEECWRRIKQHVERAVPYIREASRSRSAEGA